MRVSFVFVSIIIFILAVSTVGFAKSDSVTVQWGDDSKQGPDGGGYKKKEDLLLMLQHMGTVQSTSIGTIPTATYIKNPAEEFISI